MRSKPTPNVGAIGPIGVPEDLLEVDLFSKDNPEMHNQLIRHEQNEAPPSIED
jgi:hypothetical protein